MSVRSDLFGSFEGVIFELTYEIVWMEPSCDLFKRLCVNAATRWVFAAGSGSW